MLNYFSYSKLKSFSTSLSNYVKHYINNEPSSPSEEMIFGSLVDVLTFFTKNSPEFKNEYIVTDISLPDTYQQIAQFVISEKVTPWTAKSALGLLNNIKKYETFEENLKKVDFHEYVHIMRHAEGKTIISNETYMNALIQADTIRTAYPDLFSDSNTVFQLELNGTLLNEYKLKGILDVVVINHYAKTIKPKDLKTGHVEADKFMYQFIKNKYYIQWTVYMELLKQLYPDYTIEPMEFIYLKNGSDTPVTIKLSEDLQKVCLNGGDYTYKNTTYTLENINDIAKNLIWHYETDYWKTSKEIKDNNYELTL